MKIVFQMAVIAVLALIAGVITNQLNPDGIPARLLFGVSPFSDGSKVYQVTADSAFVYLFQEKVQFIDIRPGESYDPEHLPEAISVPFSVFFKQKILLTDSGKAAILYGEKEDSLKVRLCTEFLQKKHKPVLMVKGGLLGWLEYGFPTEKDMP